MLHYLRKSLLFLPRRRRWLLAGLVPLSVASAAVEAAGAAGVFLLITVLSDPDQGADLPATAALYTWFPSLEGMSPVLWMTALLALFYLLKNAFLALVIYLQNRLFQRTAAGLARSLLAKYLDAPYAFHLKRTSPELIHRVTEGCDRVVSLVLGAAVAGSSEALVVLGILTVLVAASPLVTLISIGALGGIMATLLLVLQERFSALGKDEIALRKEVLGTVQQTLEGLREIRVFGRERLYHARFSERRGALAHTVTRLRFLEQLPRLAIESLFIAATLLVVVLVVGNSRAAPEVVPLLGLYGYAGFRVIPSFNRLIMHANNFSYGAPSVDDLGQDLRSVYRVPAESAPEVGEEIDFQDRIAFHEVSYAYDRGQILDKVSFTIPKGGSVGLVGSTGAGKSTLIDLLLGLLEPSDGCISVDGVDIHQGLASWRRKIGYVPQTIFLVDDTLRRNIAFALNDGEIDEERVRQAVRLARLEDLVAEMPEGLETVLGESGVRLSGGQRQRVAIARALYHDPELLIFDEATSALDGRAERELNTVLQSLPREKTTLVVAHRPSTIRSCDHLVFLRGGRIDGRGSYDELLRANEAFRNMVGLPGGSG